MLRAVGMGYLVQGDSNTLTPVSSDLWQEEFI